MFHIMEHPGNRLVPFITCSSYKVNKCSKLIRQDNADYPEDFPMVERLLLNSVIGDSSHKCQISISLQ